ncbi:MAG: hypothetical protein QG588_656 [Candidatus Poribacteria bacterium]|nr:hypothetical protein [Candidatus Poribacteria bacterium]
MTKIPVKIGILITKKVLKDIESKINSKIDKRHIYLVVYSIL